MLRGVCVQTAFHAEQTNLQPLFDFPSEFIRTVAGGSNAKETTASFGEMRNTQRILFGEPAEEKAVGRTRRRCGPYSRRSMEGEGKAPRDLNVLTG